VLCLPVFLPAIPYAQRVIGLRKHDGHPRAWEVLQHWLVFSAVFEAVVPRLPRLFHSTADPLDAAAYLASGAAAWLYWSVVRGRYEQPQPSPGKIREASGLPGFGASPGG
jgi:hypothetical protein